MAEEQSMLEMSDDEVAAMDLNSLPAVEPEPEAEPEPEIESQDDADDTAEPESDAADVADEPAPEPAEAAQEEAAPEVAAEKTDAVLDYEAEYNRILAPFKANGKELKVDSVDDAIALMKMGANYNKKMAGLKPNLKLLKMLENNGLLDESKLNYLIDLDKKSPDAIAKLIKDSGIDPLDVDTTSDTAYQPKTYTVSDKEVELDTVLEEIQDTPSYQTTINVISNKWDDASKRILVSNPQIIKVINDHVASGIYEQITQVIENERMFGRLEGLSDLEAYRQVGDALNAQGRFNAPQRAPVQTPVADSRRDDPQLKNRKRAASSTKAAPTKQRAADFNPLALSDEEFEKIANSKYM